VTGDAELAESFAELLQHARPDLEEELARRIGDTPAYYAARFLRGGRAFARRTVDSLARNVGEYLEYESGALAARAELESHHQGVDRLREDVDRLAARLALLEARVARTR